MFLCPTCYTDGVPLTKMHSCFCTSVKFTLGLRNLHAYNFSHLNMWDGNNFTQIILSVQFVIIELIQLGTSFSAYRPILTTFWSSIKGISSRSRLNE